MKTSIELVTRERSMQKSRFEKYSDEWWAEIYLRHGSVEAVQSECPGLPISTADLHRKIQKYEIVKGIGRRNVSLAEMIYFFSQKVLYPDEPLETFYRSMPYRVKRAMSMSTMHRIFNYVRTKTIRTYAVALMMTPNFDPSRFLVVDESTENKAIGKIKGYTSIPVGFAKPKEDQELAILRVLQRELSTKLTLSKRLTPESPLTKAIITPGLKPFMYVDLLDVRVAAYHLYIPDFISTNLSEFASSFKVENHRLVDLESVDYSHLRPGVLEILEGYNQYRHSEAHQPYVRTSLLNEMVLAQV